MTRFLLVCLGGAAGTGARYALSSWILARTGPGFPWGTLAVNAIGSFLLGALVHIGAATDWLSPTARFALAAGVLGGFTTYSAFNQALLESLERGEAGLAALNVVATLGGCLLAGVAGAAAARGLTAA